MSKELNAFPTQSWEYDGQNNVLQYQEPGMTLRDYFAAKAVVLWAENYDRATAAKWAYEMADEMLKAREGE